LPSLIVAVVLLRDFVVEGTGSREIEVDALLPTALLLIIRQVEGAALLQIPPG
jgi:hypothetical protein